MEKRSKRSLQLEVSFLMNWLSNFLWMLWLPILQRTIWLMVSQELLIKQSILNKTSWNVSVSCFMKCLNKPWLRDALVDQRLLEELMTQKKSSKRDFKLILIKLNLSLICTESLVRFEKLMLEAQSMKFMLWQRKLYFLKFTS